MFLAIENLSAAAARLAIVGGISAVDRSLHLAGDHAGLSGERRGRLRGQALGDTVVARDWARSDWPTTQALNASRTPAWR